MKFVKLLSLVIILTILLISTRYIINNRLENKIRQNKYQLYEMKDTKSKNKYRLLIENDYKYLLFINPHNKYYLFDFASFASHNGHQNNAFLLLKKYRSKYGYDDKYLSSECYLGIETTRQKCMISACDLMMDKYMDKFIENEMPLSVYQCYMFNENYKLGFNYLNKVKSKILKYSKESEEKNKLIEKVNNSLDNKEKEIIFYKDLKDHYIENNSDLNNQNKLK